MALKAVTGSGMANKKPENTEEVEAREIGRAIDRAALFQTLPTINEVLDKMIEQLMVKMDEVCSDGASITGEWAVDQVVKLTTMRMLKKRMRSAATA